MSKQSPWDATFEVGEIVRAQLGRRFRVLEADNARHQYVIQRIKVNGESDVRCGRLRFPAGFLSKDNDL